MRGARGAANISPPSFTRGDGRRPGGSIQCGTIPKTKNMPKLCVKTCPPWERRLWYCFLRSYPVRFQRQKCIDHYIVDFYCFRAKLVVELDGGGHYEPEAQCRDDVRTKALEKYGLKVLRICNLDIDRNFEGVCAFIDMEVQKRMAGV